MSNGVSGDLAENLLRGRLRPPIPKAGCFGMIQYHPREVERPRRVITRDGVGAEPFVTPTCQLVK